jgi:hypothetical protein
MHPTIRFLSQHPLLRGRPWVGFGRFLWWQGISRLRPGRHRYDWIGASKLWLQRGWGGLTGNYYAGLHEFEDMAFLLHLLRPDDRFVDVGANMGVTRFWLAGFARPVPSATSPYRSPSNDCRTICSSIMHSMSGRVW